MNHKTPTQFTRALPATAPHVSARNGDTSNDRVAQSRVQLEQAKQLLAANRLAESETVFSRVLLLGIFAADASFGLGVVRFRSGDLDHAQTCFEQVLRLAPRNAAALYCLGAIAERRQEWTRAHTLYINALAIDHHNQVARAGLERLAHT